MSLNVGDLLGFLLPDHDYTRCPVWPPDVFACAAVIMRRSGAYVRAVELSRARVAGDMRGLLLPEDWPKASRKLGNDWHSRLRDDPESIVPSEVSGWWATITAAVGERVEDVARNDSLCAALLKLVSVSDETCAGIGFVQPVAGRPAAPTRPDRFLGKADLCLLENDFASLCKEVPSSRAAVLPKQHTPQ